MSVSAAKDTPFTAAVLVLSLLCWDAIEDPKAFFASKRRCIAFVLMVVFTYHLRKNGVAALVLLPLMILMVRGFRKKAVCLCAAGLAVTLLVNAMIYAAFQPFDQPSFQTYSLPAQQLVRAYNVGEMTEEEKEELRSWYVDENWGLLLHPHLADAAKGYLDQEKLKEDAGGFMDLWARVGRKNPRVYAEAFLMLNIGSWYPDDLTHSRIYRDTSGLLKGYLQVICARLFERLRLEPRRAADDSDWTHRALTYLNEHFTEDISLDDLARHLSISKYHLSRTFPEKIGCGLNAYLHSLRADHAAQLLASTDLSVTQAGFDSGFSSASTFFRVFQAQYSLSPRAYRAARRAQGQ